MDEEGIVAADTSSLIALAALGAFRMLRELFGCIHVTAAVRDEILAVGGPTGKTEVQQGIEEGWIVVAEVSLTGPPAAGLGVGETSVLALADTHQGPSLLLLDDRSARSRARAQGKRITGVVGILLMAKRQGLILAVGPFLERARATGFRLSDSVFRDALAAAGESLPETES